MRAELLERGLDSSLLVAKHGFSQSEAYDGDRQVQYNEITMYSFSFVGCNVSHISRYNKEDNPMRNVPGVFSKVSL